jgi:membrane protein required for colicin V production
MNLAWPDVVIAIVLGLGAFSGFRRGLVNELTGAVAFAAAIAAAFFYTGVLDAPVAARTHLGPGSAHVVAMILFALIAYAIVLLLGLVLSGFAKLPVINIANGLGGAAVGFLKALLFAWIAIYVALFFPLSPDLRRDLHNSVLVALITRPNSGLDDHVESTLPGYVKPFTGGLFEKHHT